ncbi:RNA-binding domain-containing protein [Desulfurococcus amylolyticus]|uniref:RNA-binding domain-containing protein n=1 Tax=Desulfurococcus amylolyticus TaxID=94694 RepID=UPI0005B1DBE2|nr:RNA-binding domain-containing protein [Desulfurococcus amylolyticus]
MVRIIVEAEVRPTEDAEKVKKAVKNIFAGDIIIQELGNKYRVVKGVSPTIESLKPLKNLAKTQQVEPALKNYLIKYRTTTSITLLLHKQAAYAGKLSLIDSEKESPLGPVKIIIEGDENELEEVVKYFST